jgi:hypothetical protein
MILPRLLRLPEILFFPNNDNEYTVINMEFFKYAYSKNEGKDLIIRFQDDDILNVENGAEKFNDVLHQIYSSGGEDIEDGESEMSS